MNMTSVPWAPAPDAVAPQSVPQHRLQDRVSEAYQLMSLRPLRQSGGVLRRRNPGNANLLIGAFSWQHALQSQSGDWRSQAYFPQFFPNAHGNRLGILAARFCGTRTAEEVSTPAVDDVAAAIGICDWCV